MPVGGVVGLTLEWGLVAGLVNLDRKMRWWTIGRPSITISNLVATVVLQ